MWADYDNRIKTILSKMRFIVRDGEVIKLPEGTPTVRVVHGIEHYAYGIDEKTGNVIYVVSEKPNYFTTDFEKYVNKHEFPPVTHSWEEVREVLCKHKWLTLHIKDTEITMECSYLFGNGKFVEGYYIHFPYNDRIYTLETGDLNKNLTSHWEGLEEYIDVEVPIDDLAPTYILTDGWEIALFNPGDTTQFILYNNRTGTTTDLLMNIYSNPKKDKKPIELRLMPIISYLKEVELPDPVPTSEDLKQLLEHPDLIENAIIIDDYIIVKNAIIKRGENVCHEELLSHALGVRRIPGLDTSLFIDLSKCKTYVMSSIHIYGIGDKYYYITVNGPSGTQDKTSFEVTNIPVDVYTSVPFKTVEKMMKGEELLLSDIFIGMPKSVKINNNRILMPHKSIPMIHQTSEGDTLYVKIPFIEGVYYIEIPYGAPEGLLDELSLKKALKKFKFRVVREHIRTNIETAPKNTKIIEKTDENNWEVLQFMIGNDYIAYTFTPNDRKVAKIVVKAGARKRTFTENFPDMLLYEKDLEKRLYGTFLL